MEDNFSVISPCFKKVWIFDTSESHCILQSHVVCEIFEFRAWSDMESISDKGKNHMKLKSFLLILLLLFCSVDGSACERWNRIRKDGFFVVGTEPSYPPFEYLSKSGKLVGFDIDLIRLLAQEMELKVRFKTMQFDAIFPAVLKEEIDLGVSCISVTESRKKVFDFTPSYYRSGQIAVVGPKAEIYKLEALEGKVVYAQRGTTGAEMAETIPGAIVRLVDDFKAVIGLMERGEPVALVADRALADHYREKLGFMTVGSPLSYEEIAMMMAKDCPEFRTALNDALRSLSEKGVLRKLREKWKM